MTSLGKKFIVPGLDQPGKQLTFDVDGYFSAASSLNLQQVTTILDKHKHGLNVDVNAVYHETKTRRTKVTSLLFEKLDELQAQELSSLLQMLKVL